MKMSNPYPKVAQANNTGMSKSQNDNIGRYTTPNPNSRNMGISNIVNAHRAKKRMEKVNTIADGNIMADIMTGKKVSLRK